MSLGRLRPTRVARGVARRGYGLAMRVGVLDYKPFVTTEHDEWETQYGSDSLAWYGKLEYLPPYSLLVGYLRFLGGEPSILDVGCGAGLFRARIEGVQFAQYIGFDHSEAAIERAVALADERTHFVVADRPPKGSGPFDVAVCSEVLYCVPEPRTLLDQIRDALRPGGHLLTSIWRHHGDTALHRMVDRRFELVDRVEVRNVLIRRHGWRMSCHVRS